MLHRKDCYKCYASLVGISHAEPLKVQTTVPRDEAGTLRGNKRRESRKKVFIEQVEVGGMVPETHEGTVLDITNLGLCLRTNIPCKVGARLNIALPIEGRIHRLVGSIRHRRDSNRDGVEIYTYGVQLEPPGFETRRAIESLEQFSTSKDAYSRPF